MFILIFTILSYSHHSRNSILLLHMFFDYNVKYNKIAGSLLTFTASCIRSHKTPHTSGEISMKGV